MIDRSKMMLSFLALGLAATGCGLTTADVRRISASELHEAQAAGEALIVDVRSREAYDAVHITGAISLPLEQFEAGAGELPREKLIATYCTWPAEATSARAALILLDLGFPDVAALRGGIDAWLAAGYELEVRSP